MKYLKFWKLPKKIWIIALIIIIGSGIFFLYPKPKEKPIQLVEVKNGNIQSLISASGTLEGTDSADLKFRIPGKLNYIGVKPGQNVTRGTLIASLDTRDFQINLQQANNTFEIKDATAKRAEDDVKDHTADENFTQREERVAAQKARDNAYDDVKAAKRALEDAFIYAPLSGIITKADFNVGQNITVADVIAQIVDETDFVFEAEVDESDIGQVKLGQEAVVTLNSYPDQTFQATVSKITPAIKTTDSGATVVIVKLDLGKPKINFVSGLNGQADIIIAKSNGVLIIPSSALLEGDEVYKKTGESYEKIEVEIGLRSDTEAEVKSGLTLENQVVTNPEDIKIDKGNSFKFPGQ